MAIQLHVNSLTKSHHFIFEACRILWRHKKIFLAFAALPILLAVVDAGFSPPYFQDIKYDAAMKKYLAERNLITENLKIKKKGREITRKHHYYDISEPQKEEISPYFNAFSKVLFLLKWLIAIPLFGIAWFRYLLDSEYKNTLRSYFTINKRFFRYLANNLGIIGVYVSGRSITAMLIMFPLFLLPSSMQEILEPLYKILWKDMPSFLGDILDLYIFFWLCAFIGTASAIGFWLIMWCGASSIFILPAAAALGKDLSSILKGKKFPHLFRTVVISFFFVMIESYIVTEFMVIAEYTFSIKYQLINVIQYIMCKVLIALVISFISFIVMGIILNIIALYYRWFMLSKS